MLGKLKHSTKERCPECGSILQIRIKTEKTLLEGESVEISVDYISCSNRNCFYERDMEQKRRRRILS